MTQPLPSQALYENLEKLRNYLKLRVEDIIDLVGVSRPTYYGWRNGRKMNSFSSANALATIQNLLKVGKHPDWKRWDNIHLTNTRRKEILNEILAGLSAPSDTERS